MGFEKSGIEGPVIQKLERLWMRPSLRRWQGRILP